MAWNDKAITNAGIRMLRRCLEGETLTLDYAAGGSGLAVSAAIMAQTGLVQQIQSFPLDGRLTDVEAGKRLRIAITNEGVTTGYSMQQLGIWGHVGADAPALFAILQDQDGIQIYSEAEFPDFSLDFYAVLAVDNAADIQVSVDTSALVSQGALQEELQAACEEVLEKAKKQADDRYLKLTGGDLSGPVKLESISIKDTSFYVSVSAIHSNAGDRPFLQVGSYPYGNGDRGNVEIFGVAEPEDDNSAANKKYVDSAIANAKAFVVQAAAPSNTNLLWIDTNTSTGGLKYYNGSAWVHVPVAYT